MSEALPAAPDQKTYWNEVGGKVWVELQDVLDRQLAPIGDRLLVRAFPGEGKRVLDVGCGAGATSLEMARRLGPAGACVGVDISAPLIAAARARAEREDVANVRFECADAAEASFEAPFDTVMSRFGVMFFADPDAAFANLRRAAPGGELVCVAWRSPMENPIFSAPALAAAPFLPPTPPPDPNGPGQFAFADKARVEGILERSGWREAKVEKLDVPLAVPLADSLTMMGRMGPVGQAMRQADEATRAKAKDAVRAALAPFVTEGIGRFTAACWLIAARA
jgi:SAM-dependent methyltransferase